LKTLQQVIDQTVKGRGAPSSAKAERPVPVGAPAEPARGVAPTAAAPAPYAFVGDTVSLTPEEAVVATCVLDARADQFLRHHPIGGRPSSYDESRCAMPVVPLTISLEIMAEAAALVEPGRCLVGMRDVRASRWFEVSDRRTVVVSAKRKRSE